MKKAFTLVCILLGVVFRIAAQMVTPQVIPVNGAVLQGGGVILQSTLGQPFTQTLTVGNEIYTSGFEQPEIIGPPIAPAAQSVCSDTAYIFTFSGVTAGVGGNQIEWATNSNFSSSTIVSSPATISVMVSAGATDTIWIRSRLNSTGCVSAADSIVNSVYSYPLNKTVYLIPPQVQLDSSTIVIIPNSQNGIQYNLSIGLNAIYSAIGTGDTLILNTGPVDSNTVFNVSAEDTNATCSILMADSLKVSVYINGSILSQTFQSLMHQSDPNYYLIVDSINSIFSDLEEAESNGIPITGDEEFEESYEIWRNYWANRVSANGTNPGSFKPAYSVLNGTSMTLPSSCGDYPAWNLEGPDVDPLFGSCSPTYSNSRQQNNSFVFQVWADPTDTEIIAAVPYSGLWRYGSSDTRWVNISQGTASHSQLLNYNVLHFAVQPGNIGTIYVTTCLGDVITNPDFFTGIYYTTDAGGTWQRDTAFDDLINSLASTDPNCYYDALSVKAVKLAFSLDGKILYALGNQKVFRNDLFDGTGWEELTQLSTDCSTGRDFIFSNICFDPTHSDYVFICNEQQGFQGATIDGSWVTFPFHGQVFFSSSNGEDGTWTGVGLQPTNPSATGFENADDTLISSLLLSKISIPNDGSGKVYAFAYDYLTNFGHSNVPTAYNNGIYEANLSDAPNFNWKLDGWGNYPPLNAVSYEGDFVVSNSKSSSTGNPIIYMPSDRLFYSPSFGSTVDSTSDNLLGLAFNSNGIDDATISPMSNCNRHTDMRSFFLLQSDPSTQDGVNDVIYLGTDGGVSKHSLGGCEVYTHTDADACITNLNRMGLYGQSITSIDLDPLDRSYLTYSAGHHTVTERKSNDWDVYGSGDTYGVNVINYGTPLTSGYIYDGGGGTGVSSLRIQGTFNLTTFDGVDSGLLHKPLEVRSNGYAYLGMRNLMKASIPYSLDPTSHQYELSFTDVIYTNTQPTGIQAFDVNEANDQIIYLSFPGPAANNAVGIINTTDGGGTWSDLTSDFTATSSTSDGPYNFYNITDIKSDPNAIDNAWVSFGGIPVDGSGAARAYLDRVWRTCDGGETWKDMSTGLPPLPVNKLLIMPYGNNVVFAATDAGVYMFQPDPENFCSGQWTCINSGIPPVPVVDLKLDTCEMKLYAGTQNWGIWSWIIPDNLIQLPVTYINSSSPGYDAGTQTVTWNSVTANYQTNFDIQDGITLHITGSSQIGMSRASNIIVEAGANLIVDDNSVLTSTCGSYWGGVIVVGFPSYSQIPDEGIEMQGKATLNNATIENALYGVSNGYKGLNNPHGGIIQATDCNFINNDIDIYMFPYGNFDPVSMLQIADESFFYGCDFQTNTGLYNFGTQPVHCKLANVVGVPFFGCTFEDKRPSAGSEDNLLSIGIWGQDAGFYVSPLCPYSLGGPCVDQTAASDFKNLSEGVRICGGNSPFTVQVNYSNFNGCIRGIRDEGVDNCTFTNDTFFVGNAAQITTSPPACGLNMDVGMILHNCTGFKVQMNNFQPATNAAYNTMGIEVSQAGTDNNLIYNNNFSNLFIGNLADGENCSTSGNTGLTYKCNINNNNSNWDFGVVECDAAPFFAGINLNQGSLSSPAGNTFSYCANPDIEINNFVNYSDPVNYWYANNINDPPPTCYTGAVLKHTPELNYCGSSPQICLTCVTEDDFMAAYSVYKITNLQYNHLYESLIDGGNTAGLLADIASSTDSNALTTELMGQSPNLSRTTLNAAVERLGFLTDNQVFNVLVANAEGVNSTVMDTFASVYYNNNFDTVGIRIDGSYILENIPLPGWMIDSINSKSDSFTYRSYLLDTVLYNKSGEREAVSNVLRMIAEDTTGFDINTYRNWIDSAGGLWGKMKKINTYLFQNNLDTIAQLLDSTALQIASSYDSIVFANYASYTSGYLTWMESDSFIDNLSSAQLAAANEIASANQYLKGSLYAQSVLNFYYDSTYFAPPPTALPDRSLRAGNRTSTNSQPSLLPLLKIYPNPAKDYITIEYNEFTGDSKIEIMNGLGEIVTVQPVSSNAQKINIDTHNMANGLYIAIIENNGIISDKGKFNIVKY